MLGAWPEVVLGVWVIVDGQPIADVAGSATVPGDDFLRASEVLVEQLLDQMAFWFQR